MCVLPTGCSQGEAASSSTVPLIIGLLVCVCACECARTQARVALCVCVNECRRTLKLRQRQVGSESNNKLQPNNEQAGCETHSSHWHTHTHTHTCATHLCPETKSRVATQPHVSVFPPLPLHHSSLHGWQRGIYTCVCSPTPNNARTSWTYSTEREAHTGAPPPRGESTAGRRGMPLFTNGTHLYPHNCALQTHTHTHLFRALNKLKESHLHRNLTPLFESLPACSGRLGAGPA